MQKKPQYSLTRRTLLTGMAVLPLADHLLGIGAWTAPSGKPGGTSTPLIRDALLAHLRALQGIADHCGGRSDGTMGFEQSAQYVERVMRAGGYDTRRQEFDYHVSAVLRRSVRQERPHERDFVNSPIVGVGSSPVGGCSAELVRPSDSYGATDASWEGVDAVGKIALLRVGNPDSSDSPRGGEGEPLDIVRLGLQFQQHRELVHSGRAPAAAPLSSPFADRIATAARAGVVGVIFFHPDFSPGGIVYPADETLLPASGIGPDAASALIADLEVGPVTVHLDVEVGLVTRSSLNVLAARPGATVTHLSGAHLDSVPDRPGMNDNGSAVAVLLEAALALPEEHSMGFAWWGAEEYGLHGSLHYVADLQGTPEFDSLEKYLNLDMVASPNYVICALGPGDDRAPYSDFFESTGQPWVPMIPIAASGGGSDHASFEQAGIPWVMLTTGAIDLKTEDEYALFGGIVGEPHDPNYHAEGDDLDNINAHALEIMAGAHRAACRALVGGG